MAENLAFEENLVWFVWIGSVRFGLVFDVAVHYGGLSGVTPNCLPYKKAPLYKALLYKAPIVKALIKKAPLVKAPLEKAPLEMAPPKI